MKTAVASSTYQDHWFGAVACHLVPFRTKRNGQVVTRYRWEGEKGCNPGFAPGGFHSIERGMQAARAHARMSEPFAL